MSHLRNFIQFAAGLAVATLLSGCALMDAFDPERPGAEDLQRQKLLSQPAGREIPDLSASKHEELGDVYMSRGRRDMALAHYQRAAGKDPDNLGAALKHGYALLETDQVEQSLDVFNGVLSRQPEAAMAHAGAGMAYFRRGLDQQAKAHLRKAVALDGSLWRAHNVLGILLTRNQDPEAALDSLGKAHGLVPDHPQVLNNLGVARMMAGDYAGAADALQQAARGGAMGEKTYNNLGIALARQGRFDQALEAFMAAGDEAKAYNNLGCALMLMGRNAQAVVAFEKAMELSPSFYVKASENMRRARMAEDYLGGTMRPAPELERELPAAPFEPTRGGRYLDLQSRRAAPFAPAGEVVPAAAAPETLRRRSAPVRPAASPAVPKPSPPAIEPWRAPRPVAGKQPWGVHVSSWRSLGSARSHARQFAGRGPELSISAVDLGEKGVWYRVLAGSYADRGAAIEHRPAVLERLGLDEAFVFPIR